MSKLKWRSVLAPLSPLFLHSVITTLTCSNAALGLAEQAKREEGNILETALGKGATEKIIGTTQKLTNVVTQVASHGDLHGASATSLPSRAPISDNFFDDFGEDFSGRKLESGISRTDTIGNGAALRRGQVDSQVSFLVPRWFGLPKFTRTFRRLAIPALHAMGSVWWCALQLWTTGQVPSILSAHRPDRTVGLRLSRQQFLPRVSRILLQLRS